jgi:hypothetical protein
LLGQQEFQAKKAKKVSGGFLVLRDLRAPTALQARRGRLVRKAQQAQRGRGASEASQAYS